MGKKKFEETPYNPIAVDLAREVTATGRSQHLMQPMQIASSVVELRPQQTSSVENDLSAKREESKIVTIRPKKTEPTITKRFVVTRSEDDELTGFLHRLQKRAGTKAPLSVIARAAVNIAMYAEDQIIEEIGSGFSMELPSTHDSIAQADYEDRWMRILASAFRKMPKLKPREENDS
jgi:hypothetical protein